MPRSEARIFTSIWRDPHFTGIDPAAQWLYLFLLSQDDLSYCGVMPLRERRWTYSAAGLLVADIESAMKVLEASPRRFVVADHDAGELFVRSLIRHDGIWKQPNLLKLSREAADQVRSRRIRGALLGELHRLPLEQTGSDLVKTLVADFIADLEMTGPYPTDYPPDYPHGHSSDDAPDHAPDDPSDDHYARAEGSGERYYLSDFPDPRAPSPGPRPVMPPRDRKTGHRLPEDFTVTAEMTTWARQNAPHVDAVRETDRFMDYWLAKPGKDGRKLDWVRTWQNWMRTAQDRQGPRDRPGSRMATTDQRMADAQALKAQLRRPAQLEITP